VPYTYSTVQLLRRHLSFIIINAQFEKPACMVVQSGLLYRDCVLSDVVIVMEGPKREAQCSELKSDVEATQD